MRSVWQAKLFAPMAINGVDAVENSRRFAPLRVLGAKGFAPFGAYMVMRTPYVASLFCVLAINGPSGARPGRAGVFRPIHVSTCNPDPSSDMGIRTQL